MSGDNGPSIAVIDFRRHSMDLEWHTLDGAWSACEKPPALVHGVALIRASQPNICVYGQSGRLRLQVGANQYALSETSPRITCVRSIASFGFRRRFTVESGTGGVLFSHSYWTNQGRDFFWWLAAKAADPDWRVTSGRLWSDGVASQVMRSS